MLVLTVTMLSTRSRLRAGGIFHPVAEGDLMSTAPGSQKEEMLARRFFHSELD